MSGYGRTLLPSANLTWLKSIRFSSPVCLYGGPPRNRGIRILLLGLALLGPFSGASVSVAQQNDWAPKATYEASQERFINAGNEALKAGAEYEASTRKDINAYMNASKALDCYLRAAAYYEKAGEKVKMFLAIRDEALKKAREWYAWMLENDYELWDGVSIDKSKLGAEGKKEEPAPEEPGSEKIPPINIEQNRLVFRTQESVFSIGIPAPFVAVMAGGKSANVYTPEQVLKIMREPGGREKLASMTGFSLQGFQISGGLTTYKQNALTEAKTAEPCEPSKAETDRTHSRGAEEMQLGLIKACLRYNWIWEIDNPVTQAKEDLTAGMDIEFHHKGQYYKFEITVRNFDREPLQKHLMAMARSFRYEGEVVESFACSESESPKLLGELALPGRWELPDATRNPFVLQKPVLKKGEVPSAWSKVSSALIFVLQGGKDVKQSYSTGVGLVKGDRLSAVMEGLKWKAESEDVMHIEFLPQSIDDFEVGSVSNWIVFYLKALRAASIGVAGIEDRLTTITQDLYWEVPYVEVKGSCIPMMFCEDGQWKEHYKSLRYVEIARYDREDHAGNLRDLSPKSVDDELKNNFHGKIRELEKNLVRFKEPEERCDDFRAQLFDMKFPTSYAKCDALKARIDLIDANLKAAQNARNSKQAELANWLKEKPNTLERLNKEVATVAGEITTRTSMLEEQKDDLKSQLSVKKTYEDNSDTHLSGYGETLDKISALQGAIAELESKLEQLDVLRKQLEGEVQQVKAGAIDKALNAEVDQFQLEIDRLEKEKADLNKALKDCE